MAARSLPLARRDSTGGYAIHARPPGGRSCPRARRSCRRHTQRLLLAGHASASSSTASPTGTNDVPTAAFAIDAATTPKFDALFDQVMKSTGIRLACAAASDATHAADHYVTAEERYRVAVALQ